MCLQSPYKPCTCHVDTGIREFVVFIVVLFVFKVLFVLAFDFCIKSNIYIEILYDNNTVQMLHSLFSKMLSIM